MMCLQIKLSLKKKKNGYVTTKQLEHQFLKTKFRAAGTESEQQSALIAAAQRPFGAEGYKRAFVLVRLRGAWCFHFRSNEP